MKPLFEREGCAALEAALLGKPLLAFDFDGTLAALVDRPGDAKVSSEISSCLSEISGMCTVAVVTGRSVEDVQWRLGFEPKFIVGNHGAQIGQDSLSSGVELDNMRDRLRRHSDALAQAGVTVEDKGLSLALHYRLASSHAKARQQIDAALHNLEDGLRCFGGKCVVNIVASGAFDKADAIECLMDRSDADTVVFVGDDMNDEPVFERALPEWVTVRVGREYLTSRAKYYLENQSDIESMLQTVLNILRERGDLKFN